MPYILFYKPSSEFFELGAFKHKMQAKRYLISRIGDVTRKACTVWSVETSMYVAKDHPNVSYEQFGIITSQNPLFFICKVKDLTQETKSKIFSELYF